MTTNRLHWNVSCKVKVDRGHRHYCDCHVDRLQPFMIFYFLCNFNLKCLFLVNRSQHSIHVMNILQFCSAN